jgi:hypothetical protein
MKTYIEREVIDFLAEKVNMRKKFLNYVQDPRNPILERLDLWESYASDILPLGNWVSDCPEWLRDYQDRNRHEIIYFTDLSECIQGADETQITFDAEGNITWLSDEAIVCIEDIFNTSLCGTYMDW